MACAMGRRFIGSELKPSYFEIAKANLEQAPRDAYRFSYFSEKVGEWTPGLKVEPFKQAEAEDTDDTQMDWTTECVSIQ